MPQFLYRLQPARIDMLTGGPTEREARIISEHFAYLKRLTEQGTVLMAGRTLAADERCFGIVVLVAPSAEDAEAIMNNDPAVMERVMGAELFPYRIALWSSRGPPKDDGRTNPV